MSSDEEYQDFEHEDSLKLTQNRQSSRSKFKKMRKLRQERKSKMVENSSSSIGKNDEMVCICVPLSSVTFINSRSHMKAEVAHQKQYFSPLKDEELSTFELKEENRKSLRNKSQKLLNDGLDETREFTLSDDHSSTQISNDLIESEQSLLEIDDKVVSVSLLGKNYRVNSYR